MKPGSPLRRVLAYVRWPQVALATALALFIGGASQGLPSLVRSAIDRFLAPPPGSPSLLLPRDGRIAGVVQVAAVYAGLAVAIFLAQLLLASLVTWASQQTMRRIRGELFAKVNRLPIAYFDSRPAGQFVSRIISDIEAINRFASTGLVTIAVVAVLVVAGLSYLLRLSPSLTAVSALAVPALLVLFRLFQRRMWSIQREIRIAQGEVTGTLSQLVGGMTTLQLANGQGAAQRDFAGACEVLREEQVRGLKTFSVIWPLGVIVQSVALAALLWLGGVQVLAGVLTVGALVAAVQYLQSFIDPLLGAAQLADTLPAASAGAERAFALLDEPEAVADAPGALVPRKLRGEVELRGVWFSYEGGTGEAAPERWAVKGLDLAIRAGESVAIVGATGAGKSSLFNLVARFYDPQRGAVLIDGIDARRYAQRALRSRLGLVLQDPLLLDETIELNLRLGNAALGFDTLVDVCRRVGADDFIRALPDGYRTRVGQAGATLSTGQKQLLAFCRTLLRDPDILLLDEATASLDSYSEERARLATQAILAGRTSLVIAHRLSTVQSVDRIIVMRRGEAIEQGSHASLLARGGYYATLVRLSGEEADGTPRAPRPPT